MNTYIQIVDIFEEYFAMLAFVAKFGFGVFLNDFISLFEFNQRLVDPLLHKLLSLMVFHKGVFAITLLRLLIRLLVWLNIGIFQQVTSDVFVQVTFLSKCQFAFKLMSMWTNKWTFFCVDSQVIIKVVPFSEVHGTPRMVAFQNF